jgi:hypothetical protein
MYSFPVLNLFKKLENQKTNKNQLLNELLFNFYDQRNEEVGLFWNFAKISWNFATGDFVIISRNFVSTLPQGTIIFCSF